MTRFDSRRIRVLFESNLKEAKLKLRSLKVCCGTEPSFAGLSGWVFEQTVEYCLQEELHAMGLRPKFKEQSPLSGRAKADLQIGDTLIEIKTSGLFGQEDVRRYERYAGLAGKRGLGYLFVSWGESHRPYRDGIVFALGKDNVFYIGEPGEWSRLVKKIVGQRPNRSPR